MDKFCEALQQHYPTHWQTYIDHVHNRNNTIESEHRKVKVNQESAIQFFLTRPDDHLGMIRDCGYKATKL